MPTSKRAAKTATTRGIDFTPLLPRSVATDSRFKRHLAAARRQSGKLRKVLEALESKMKGLENQDRMSNFEIQELMSRYNQAETLVSSLLKTRDDTANAVIQKVG